MRFGVLGVIWGDWTDVTHETVAFARELGFSGIGAHLTVPASTVSHEVAVRVRASIDGNGLEFLQVWGPYPSIISADEEVRRRGVEGASDIARLAARLGVPASGIRPTSHNPRGDWWPHPENHSQASEDRLVRSIDEVLEVAVPLGVGIVLEKHATSTLDSAQRVKRVIERTDPRHVRVNIDPANFVADLATAFDPTPMVNELFDVLGEHCATVHVKDYDLEDRFIVHISEAVPGTGMMDLDTVLRRTAALGPESYAIVEHLPLDQIGRAKHHLAERAAALGIEVH
ncbi:MAG TPA: sugar phosphate isomerase/epimerase [Candidatus Deferrimicrobium sp.]|nr:sugar phosphate isomerase/epimerase [Candidatus Deferrimicrobium sp.]